MTVGREALAIRCPVEVQNVPSWKADPTEGYVTFEQHWDAARYNVWYWVSYAFMIAVPIVGALLVAIRFRGRVVLRTLNLCLASGCLVVTTGTTMLSIEEKWDARWLAAQSETQRDRVVISDTGNRASRLSLVSVAGP